MVSVLGSVVPVIDSYPAFFPVPVDAAKVGGAYMTGVASSDDFPIENPLQPDSGGIRDAFITEIEDDWDSCIIIERIPTGRTDYTYRVI
jgi:hypothetical protein